MSDIFREVDEDLRRERMKKLWERYGKYLIGLAVLIVVVTAGYRGWEYWQTSQAESNGDRFVAAIMLADEGRHEDALAALGEIERSGRGGYPFLAAFRSASEQAAAGDVSGAIASYEAVVQRGDVPTLVADMARLRAAMLSTDSAGTAALSSQIGDLAQTGNPWRHVAREILGVAAYRESDYTTARTYFDEIVGDEESGPGVRERAEMMLALIDARVGPTIAPDAEPGEG